MSNPFMHKGREVFYRIEIPENIVIHQMYND